MRRLAFLLLLVLAAGCGGSGSGELSRTEYTKRANASCVKAEQALDELGGFANFKELEREMKIGRDAMNTSAQELRELRPPVKLRRDHELLIEVTEKTAAVADRLSTAAGKNAQLEMQKQAERAEELTIEANEIARRLGLLECVAG